MVIVEGSQLCVCCSCLSSSSLGDARVSELSSMPSFDAEKMVLPSTELSTVVVLATDERMFELRR